MISMWVLAMLVVSAAGLAHRASLNLKLSRLQRDSLRARLLARAEIKKAMAQLSEDRNDYDWLNEIWNAARETNFGSAGTFTLKITDEERKININTASLTLISSLLRESGINEQDALAIAEFIRIWRGDNALPPGPKADTDKLFKKSAFNAGEELVIVLEYFYQNSGAADYRAKAVELYEKIKDLVTVFPAGGSAGKVNINTVIPKALELLIKSGIADLEDAGIEINADAGDLLNKILEYRREKPFGDIGIENSLDIGGPAESDFRTIIAGLKPLIDIKSQNFAITCANASANTGARPNIECVFNRESGKILYWHEN